MSIEQKVVALGFDADGSNLDTVNFTEEDRARLHSVLDTFSYTMDVLHDVNEFLKPVVEGKASADAVQTCKDIHALLNEEGE